MAAHTKIEWTDATWNPVTGCSVVSPGCTNCYAMKLAGTRLQHHPSRAGLTRDTKVGPVWTGEVRFNAQWLDQPLRWRQERLIFVCAHGDLFHESVPDEWIDHVFAVMALARRHTFQVLTKRSERMQSYCSTLRKESRILAIKEAASRIGGEQRWHDSGAYDWLLHRRYLPNVWLGVSAEDQSHANARIPHLLATPAAVRFLSAEPLLGPLDLSCIDVGGYEMVTPLRHWSAAELSEDWGEDIDEGQPALDWVIVGGESGPNARPMHPDWARSLRDQCAAAGVPIFFKQWGEWLHLPARAHFKDAYPDHWRRVEADSAGVRPALMFRVGKAAAGRLLDGVEHTGFPKVRR